MIGSVSGTVIERGEDHVVVEAGGIGYQLIVSTETLKAVPALGQEVRMLSEMVVRDDSILLYGFSKAEERELFRLLTTVNGVGPKVAVAALSASTPRKLADAVFEGDPSAFEGVPGIGKRTAERIIVELRGKVKGIASAGRVEPSPASDGPSELARAGLMGLGYDSSEAEELLTGLKGDTAEELIATALRRAASGRQLR